MKVITLESLKDTIKAFSTHQCISFTEYCITALEHNDHISGCQLSISGDTFTNFTINWTSEVNKAGYKNADDFVEYGAVALSFFLSLQLTGYTVIKQAEKGTGIDYWLGYDKQHKLYDPKNFLKARLEVSGINKEISSNNIAARIRAKKKQTTKSDSTMLPIFISIIEFSTPKAHFEKR